MNNSQTKGILYIVATPIGNMQDITLRAIQTLTDVDVVCAEDTRVTGSLVSRSGVKNWRTRVVPLYGGTKTSKITHVSAPA